MKNNARKGSLFIDGVSVPLPIRGPVKINNTIYTARYLKALEVFDPKDSRPQLAEFWTFKSSQFERFGYL